MRQCFALRGVCRAHPGDFLAMSDVIVAVADSPFPSLDPVEKVLRPLGARLRMSASSCASRTSSPWPATPTR